MARWQTCYCELCGAEFLSETSQDPYCKKHRWRGCRCFKCGSYFETHDPARVPGEKGAYLCPECANPAPIEVLPSWQNRTKPPKFDEGRHIPDYLANLPGVRFQPAERFFADIADEGTKEAREREAHKLDVHRKKGKAAQMEATR